jgi:dehydrogenase/reductase SDR family protein 12
MSVRKLLGSLIFYGRFAPSFTRLGYVWRRLGARPVALDLRGQAWVVTGASAGLGRALALAATAAGAEVAALARPSAALAGLGSEGKAAAAGGGRLLAEACDLSSQRDTARWLRQRIASGRPVDVLVNNVGVLPLECRVNAEGREASYATNLLSHFQLTETLAAHGLLGGQPGEGRRALVLNMTSGGAYAVPLALSRLDTTDPAQFDGTAAYAFHKRAQIALTAHWRSTLGPRGIDVHALHPGWVDTEGVRRSLPRFRRSFGPLLRDAAQGIDTALWLAAIRPPPPEPDRLWFDRRVCDAHAFAATRRSSDTPAALAAALAADLARFPDDRV